MRRLMPCKPARPSVAISRNQPQSAAISRNQCCKPARPSVANSRKQYQSAAISRNQSQSVYSLKHCGIGGRVAAGALHTWRAGRAASRTPDEEGNQWSSEVISGHGRAASRTPASRARVSPTVAPPPSAALLAALAPRPPRVTARAPCRTRLCQSVAIGRNQCQSVAVNGSH